MTEHAVMVPAFHSPLAGVQLIEASAGTGKTWTLSALFARLIVEKGLSVSQILAITFTKAAAAELRDRIRNRLLELAWHLDDSIVRDDGYRPDPFCAFIGEQLAGTGGRGQARDRLLAALSNFDEATITTINGFCQGVLVEQALASGMPLEAELLTDIAPLLHEIIQDYCRQQWRQAEPLLVAHFLTSAEFSLPSLYGFVNTILQQGQARIDRPEFHISGATLRHTRKLFAQVQALWRSERTVVRGLFLADKHKDKASILSGYNQYIDSWLEQLDVALSSNVHAILGGKVPELLLRFSTDTLVAKRKKDAVTRGVYFPEHPLFPLLQQLAGLAADCQAQLHVLALKFRFELLDHCRSTLVQRLYDRQAQSFDMQIKGLANALAHPDGGNELALSLRARYPAALVDEFQDTDDYQYQILQHVYLHARDPQCALFLVGDPKQAIYRFRGADVYTYLRAYEEVAEHDRHHLEANQRSVSPLIQALNRFFTAAGDDAFRQRQIRYRPVTAGERPHAPLLDRREGDTANLNPLRLLYCPGDGVTKDQGRQWAVQACVQEIRRLLAGAKAGEVMLGDDPVEGHDIVILVRSHFEAEACRAALAQVGVKAALQSRNRVFDSIEAEDMARVLAAFADPHNEGKVRAVLASRLCGATVQDLLAWQADAKAWTAHLVRFQDYQKRWRERGFMAAWRLFLHQEDVITRLAGLPQGERVITNFAHLADLLHEEYRQRPGMRQLGEWFAQQRLAPQESLNAELRLESDENLIRIMTIHQSKGLEFPIVFVPTLWSPPDPERGVPFYHQDGQGVFDLSLSPSDEVREQVWNEVLSEDLRLGYVALTRAAQRCYVLWCPYDGKSGHVGDSALGHWLPDGMGSLRALAEAAPGQVGLYPVPVELAPTRPFMPGDTPPPPSTSLAAPNPPAWLPRGFRLTSFSSLHQGARALQAHDEGTVKDDDNGRVQPIEHEDEAVAARFSFAGRQVQATHVGNCLHKIFEHADFTVPVETWADIIDRELAAHGILPAWQPDLIAWLTEVMPAPLSPTLRLNQLDEAQTLRELDFHLPLDRFQPHQLIRCLRDHGLEVPELPAQTITGYLKGSIDLVFEHNGQYFIADYKSNHLGHQLDNYRPAELEKAMASHGYKLQAALYALALHRWLSGRLAGYDFDRHLGGVYYLFLRGMHPHGREGIHFWKPPRALLDELGALVGEGLLGAMS